MKKLEEMNTMELIQEECRVNAELIMKWHNDTVDAAANEEISEEKRASLKLMAQIFEKILEINNLVYPKDGCGSNMQRQGVAIMRTWITLIPTGLKYIHPLETLALQLSAKDLVVQSVSMAELGPVLGSILRGMEGKG